MTQSSARTKEPTGKKTAQMLRERLGGVPKTVLERSREQARTRRTISEALKTGPKTVPEIHAATGIPADTILWYLMALKKYGQVVEGEQRDSYYEYSLAKEGRKQE